MLARSQSLFLWPTVHQNRCHETKDNQPIKSGHYTNNLLFQLAKSWGYVFWKTNGPFVDTHWRRKRHFTFPEHTIFSCKRWSNERKAAWKKLGRVVNADTLLGEMMKTREKWRAGYEYIVDIMKRKEVEDRMRQQEEGNNME
ncbi:hypothetical protein WA026_022037 [Henosepilachna vigintioctopunctata]|uniref:Uncharacterized protein n=1 Tax=Henosepilachna vigintioctopunctata TaxID=420089 RepID=A0AAW1UVB2_9CUCU